MSRIGNKIITIPAGVEVKLDGATATVKGPKGELTRAFSKDIEIKIEGTEITLHRPNDSKEMKTIHGTTRANLNNMVIGVSEGFRKELEMRGVGYRAQLAGNKLTLSVGKSHPDEVVAPDGITFEVPSIECILKDLFTNKEKEKFNEQCRRDLYRWFRENEPFINDLAKDIAAAGRTKFKIFRR